jgi:2-keto-4-pentenoate hydratase/2-oxohepta-3-ene-1,7-dioic acid hydratase in catechol pathway
MQSSNTADMIFPLPYIVSYLSECMTLLPGTVILTGTPEGVGFTRTPPLFLKAGDVVACEIEGIGTIRNQVIQEHI